MFHGALAIGGDSKSATVIPFSDERANKAGESGRWIEVDQHKTGTSSRLENALPILREQKPGAAMAEALVRISRRCSTRFASAVAAGRVLRTEEEVLAFARLPDHLIGNADLEGVHNSATLKEFLGKVKANVSLMGDWERQRRESGQWEAPNV